MTVKELRALLIGMPDDLMVLIPVGMDWKEPVQVREEGVTQIRPPYWTHRQGAPTRAVLIRPYLGPKYVGGDKWEG